MRPTLLIAGVLALALAGCGLSTVLSDFQGDNPDAAVVPIDDNADGIPDAYAQAHPDGTVKIDPSTGKPLEVPGTRAAQDKAKATDNTATGLLTLLSSLGIPGAAVAGKYWGKVKPAQRATHWEAMFKGVVKSVQTARKSGEIPDDIVSQLDALMHDVQIETDGLVRAIKAAKVENAA